MHLVQRPVLRSHFALAVEQFWQAFCREVEYLEVLMAGRAWCETHIVSIEEGRNVGFLCLAAWGIDHATGLSQFRFSTPRVYSPSSQFAYMRRWQNQDRFM